MKPRQRTISTTELEGPVPRAFSNTAEAPENPLVATKHGKLVAKIVAIEDGGEKQRSRSGSVRVLGDISAPLDEPSRPLVCLHDAGAGSVADIRGIEVEQYWTRWFEVVPTAT